MKIKREIYICSVTVPAPISGHELPESQMRTSDRVYTASVSDLEICRSFQAPTWAPSVHCSLHSSPRDPPPVGHIRSLLSFKHFNNILSQKIKPKVFATAGEALCDPGPGDLLSSFVPPSPSSLALLCSAYKVSIQYAPLPSACVVLHFPGPLFKCHLLREVFHDLFPTHPI